MGEALLYWGLGLLALSLLLIVAEVFLPSAGVVSVLAVAVAAVGLVCLFRFDWRWGLAGLLAAVVLGPVAFVLGVQIFPATPLGRRLIGESPTDQPPPDPGHESLIGAEAEALTDLRPGGFVRVLAAPDRSAPARLQAISEVAFIGAGSRVRITGADGLAVRVRPLEPDPAPSPGPTPAPSPENSFQDLASENGSR